MTILPGWRVAHQLNDPSSLRSRIFGRKTGIHFS
jgi:hypothetical protein